MKEGRNQRILVRYGSVQPVDATSEEPMECGEQKGRKNKKRTRNAKKDKEKGRESPISSMIVL